MILNQAGQPLPTLSQCTCVLNDEPLHGDMVNACQRIQRNS